MLSEELKKEIKAVSELGCSDGGCLFSDNRGGMSTNGGCRCLNDLSINIDRSMTSRIRYLINLIKRTDKEIKDGIDEKI